MLLASFTVVFAGSVSSAEGWGCGRHSHILETAASPSDRLSARAVAFGQTVLEGSTWRGFATVR